MEDKDLPYTILEKVEGKPQMLKLAPMNVPKKYELPARQFPLADAPAQRYPKGN